MVVLTLQTKGCLRPNKYERGPTPAIFTGVTDFLTAPLPTVFEVDDFFVVVCCVEVLTGNVVVAVDNHPPFPPVEFEKKYHTPPRTTATAIIPAIILLFI